MEYITLFFISFTASTILPVSSEATLYYYLHNGSNWLYLLLVAGIGNTLGSILNYFIGEKGVDYLLNSGKLSYKSYQRSKNLFAKWGGWSLLLSWVPIIGDPITLLAGALKYPFIKFLIIVTIAKFGRYIAIILFQQY